MENFNNIAYLVALVLSVLNAIITFVRTGTLKKEYKNMLYRSPDYKKTDEQKQSFSNLKTEYVLNERIGELEEKTEKTDLQSLINSSIDTALDRVLQRLQPQGYDLECDLESQDDSMQDDLMDYAYLLDLAEDYREKFGLSLSASTADIFSRVQEESNSIKQRLDNLRKSREEKTKLLREETDTMKQQLDNLRKLQEKNKEINNEPQKEDK